MRNIKMVVEYQGTAYHGWQRQKNGLSIQELIEDKLGVITGEKISVLGSGRTDAGVHALAQVVNFRTNSNLAERNLLVGLNSLLPADIAIKELKEVDESFHARKDATGKIYFYRIFNRPYRSALNRNSAWIIYAPLDIDKMREAAEHMAGTHDFTSFCSVHSDVEGKIRTIRGIEIVRKNDDIIRIDVEADGFLRGMVRIIVGTLVDIGKGRRCPEDIPAIIEAKDRQRAGMTAPPQGLFLKEVKY